jgi:hypothetical protein
VAALREVETEERGAPERREMVFAKADRRRVAHGIPPLRDEFDDIPEVGFHACRASRTSPPKPLRS